MGYGHMRVCRVLYGQQSQNYILANHCTLVKREILGGNLEIEEAEGWMLYKK